LELAHSFTVPASVDETWAAFQDIESVAGCFPGATVTEVSGDDFKGTCKVKLGPIALTYAGQGTFVEKDESARRFVVEAKGKDKRGNGTAGATVTATFAEEPSSGTRVDVTTDLSITGKPAQFGRGVMQDVSDKLLQQFVNCLQDKVGSDGGPDGADGGAAESTFEKPATEESLTPTGETSATEQVGADVAGARKAPYSAQLSAPPADDALDLGATVLPVLAKNYWRQALAVVLVLLVLRRLLRRR
jgi:carbon monoxide dehydrogenase subunit G